MNPKFFQHAASLTLLIAIAVQPRLDTLAAGGSDATTLSFGRIMYDEAVEQTIVVANPFDRKISISNIQLTPPLQAQEIQPTALPGENFSFHLLIGENRRFGEYEGWIRINFEDDQLEPIIIAVEGYVVPPIELKPGPAFYVVTRQGEDKAAFIEIINHREQPLVISDVRSESSRFTTKLEVKAPGKQYVLKLFLDGHAEAGQKTEKILLTTEPNESPPMTILANTIIQPRVYTFPASVDLGALPIGLATDKASVSRLAQTLMVYRLNSTGFEVSVSTDLEFLDVESERGPNGDRYQITLTLIPERIVPGEIDGLVRIETNDEAFRLLEVPVVGYILD
jgi:hypothetical protein